MRTKYSRRRRLGRATHDLSLLRDAHHHSRSNRHAEEGPQPAARNRGASEGQDPGETAAQDWRESGEPRLRQSTRLKTVCQPLRFTLALRWLIVTAPSSTSGQKASAVKVAFIVSLAVLLTLALLRFSDWPREAALMAGIFVLAALLWVTEATTLFATSLLVIGLQVILLANPGGWAGLGFATGSSPGYRAVLAAAADPILLLFFGGFLLARAAVKEGVDQAMSSLLLRPFGGQPKAVLLGLMLVTALFSMWMSNTATTAMMMTLVVPMLAQLPPNEIFRKGLVLAVPLAANIGGMGTPIASPPNAVAVGFLQKAGIKIGFLDWMLVAVPLMLLLLLLVWLLLDHFFKPTTSGLRLEAASRSLNRRGWFVVVVFFVTVLLWMTDQWHGLPSSVVALLPAVAFTTTGLLNRDDLNGIEWNILILIAGGISLGAGMQMAGLDQQVVKWLPSGGTSGTLLLAALVVATIGLSTFMSNTAAANLLLPVGISSAMALGGAGLSGTQAALSIALAASLSMSLPISTPPNAIAYASGEFTTRDLMRVGVIIALAGALLIIAGSGFVLRFWGITL